MRDGAPHTEGRKLFGIAAYEPVNRFRTRRGRVLRDLIDGLAGRLGRDIAVLDVGGRPDYWQNVGVASIARIELLNLEPAEFNRPIPAGIPADIFVPKLGDACDLADYGDKSVDLVHSNSVIEHVGGWARMAAMAGELLRVGRAGWVQTPAWSFPLEPHFRVARPLQARMMSLSFVKRHRDLDLGRRRGRVERINLLSRREVEVLFPGQPIHVERFVLAKSYCVHWLPPEISRR